MNKQQLANKIWASANNMRNKIAANEYKDYILGLIFYKFLSDTEIKYFTEVCDWEKEELVELVENYEDPDLKNAIEECQEHIGFFIEYKYLFNTWLNDDTFSVATLSEALSNFERLMSNNYAAVYEGIFRTLREGLGRLGDDPTAQTKALKKLIKLIKDIPTDGSQDYDVLGYVYEYLISNFAANSGKKAGEFYTPHEVAMVMSEIVAEHHKNKESLEIYDPTSGSGSLLITIGKAVSKHIQGQNKIKYYAQELKESTYNLTRMNLVMRGIIPQNIVTRCADSLEEDWPIHEEGSEIDKPLAVDAVVSNPPYSQHWDSKDKELDARFAQYGIAPKTKADYAFLLHELHHLKSDGILAIVLPHGVLFRDKTPKLFDNDGNLLPIEEQEEGKGEGQIRANLIEKNNIDTIIGLPANIFFGTGIPTIIMILKKNRGNEGILFIDASKGFVKDGKQNRLRARDVKKITDTFRERKDIPGYSRVVSRNEIRRNGYNLNIPRYVDSSEPAIKYDIYSTVFGGIPNNEIADLEKYWNIFPTLQQEIFAPESDRPYSSIKVENVLETIQQNTEVKQFESKFTQAFAGYKEMLHQRLIDHVDSVQEVKEIDQISADLFRRFVNLPLIDKYEGYQILAANWSNIMGDIEIIQTEGIGACNVVEPQYKIVKNKNDEEVEVQDGEKGRIMPFKLIQQTYFSNSLQEIQILTERIEAIDGDVEAITNEFDEDEREAYLDSEKDNDPETKKIRTDAKPKADTEPETKEKLQAIVKLWDEKSAKKKLLKKAILALEEATKKKIATLNMKEINDLLEIKWILPITTAIDTMPDVLLKDLARLILSMNEKYAVTFNDIERNLKTAQDSFAELVGELSGDEFSIKGLNVLIRAASLQSMFPQEGETIPKVRFKGFEGEWEKKEISQLCSKQSAHLTESSLGHNIGQYPVFGANGYIQNITHYDMPNPYIGIIKDGSGVGRANIFPAFSSVLGTLTYIQPKENFDLYFLLSIFRNIDLSKYKSGSSIPHIYFKDYGKVEVLVPSTLEEQQKIGQYFENLDNQISLQSLRLEKLKQIKTACLDKMFV